MLDLRTTFGALPIGAGFRHTHFHRKGWTEIFVKCGDESAMSTHRGDKWLLRGPFKPSDRVWRVTLEATYADPCDAY